MKRSAFICAVAATALSFATANPLSAQGRSNTNGGSTPNGKPFVYLNELIANNSAAIADLESDSSVLLAGLAALESRVSANEGNIAANAAAIGGILDEIGAINGTIAAQQAEIGDLHAQIVRVDAEADQDKAELEAALAALGQTVSNGFASLQSLYASLAATLDAQAAELAAFKLEVADQNAAALAQIDAINATIAQLRSEIPSLSDINAIVANNTLVIDLQQNVATLQSAVSGINNDILALDGELTLVQASISDLDTRVTANTDAIADLNVRIDTLGSNTGLPSLDDEVASLPALLGNVTAVLPNAYAFNYDGNNYNSSNLIYDGGRDMYDAGNILQSPLQNNGALDYWPGVATAMIPYTNGQLANGDDAYGTDSSYYTIEGSGVFVLSVRNATVDRAWISGNLGADGSGAVVGNAFEVTFEGATYQVFTKSVTDAYGRDPSVVHVWILPAGVEINHTYSNSTNSDFDQIATVGGEPLGDFYYLLLSSHPPFHPSQAQLEQVVAEFFAATRG